METAVAAYAPTYLRIENTGENWKEESEFRLLVVSKAFEDLKGTRRKPGGRNRNRWTGCCAGARC